MTIERYAVNTELEHPKNANVADIYKNSTIEEIRADLNTRRSKLVNVCMNLTKDFNKGSVIRAGNAMSAAETYIVGESRKYNRVGAVGTYLYEHVFHAPTLEEVVEHLHQRGYTVFAVDNVEGVAGLVPENAFDVQFPEMSAFVYGEEQKGLSSEQIALCDRMVFINQTGSVRSMNVSQAAACLMFAYTAQHRL